MKAIKQSRKTTVLVAVDAAIARASMQRPQNVAPNMRMVLRPTKCRIAYMPTLTPMKPMQVFMTENLNASSTVRPPTIMKYVA